MANASTEHTEESTILAPDARPVKKPKRFNPIGIIIILIVLAALIIGGIFLMRYLSSFQDTDDAQVDGHLDAISARINGTVTKVHFEDNQTVKQGQVLVELDPRDYKVAVEQAQANVAQAQAQLNAEDPNLAITQSNNVNQISTTASDILNAKAAVSAAERDYQTALANIAVARANSVKSQSDVKRYQQLIVKNEISHEQFDTVVATAAAQASQLAAMQASAASAKQVIDERRAALAEARSRYKQANQTAPKQVSINRANITTRKSAIAVQKALLDQALLNLSYCTIKPQRMVWWEKISGNRPAC